MAEISKKEFLSAVGKSQVIELNRLKDWMKTLEATDAAQVATKMVRDKLLTNWQARYLMSGRTRLDIGSYRLLERIQRDELGDRFLAIHIQLGRKVDIQVLPANLTRDKNSCDAFIKKASQTAKLDHPHLKHVYDIDQEGGRYFLVTEHLAGKTLDQFPRSGLKAVDVARIIDQALSGLEFAHEHNVFHGSIGQQDLVVTEQGVKIQNLAVSPLRTRPNGQANSSNTAPANGVADLQSLGRIGSLVLNEIMAVRKEEVDDLPKIFNHLTDAEQQVQAQARKELADWLMAHDSESSEETDKNLAGKGGLYDERWENGPSNDGEDFERPIASELASVNGTSSRRSKTYDDDSEETDNEYEEELEERIGYFKRLADENPVGFLATIGVVGLILVAGLGFGAAKMFGKPAGTRTAGLQRNDAVHSDKNSQEKSNLPPTGFLSQPVAQKSVANFDDPAAMQDQIRKALEANNAKIEPAIKDKAAPKPPAQPPVKTDAGPQTQPASKLEENTPPATASAAPNSTGVPVSEKSPAEPSKTDPPNTEPKLSEGSKTNFNIESNGKPEKTEPEKTKPTSKQPTQNETPAADADPFKNFPTTVQLPPLENIAEVKIADLVISSRFLLGAEIMAYDGVTRGKMLFEMDRDEHDKQKWVATVRRNERAKKEPIAAFRKSDSEFFFQWLPEAENNRYAGYIQNCMLKLLIPDNSTILKLREPIELGSMQLTEGALFSVIDAELPFLPDPDILFAEILPTEIPESTFKPAQIDFQRDLPGRITLIAKDDDPFVWVQVTADIKQRSKFRTDLVVFAMGKVQPIKNLIELNELASTLKQRETGMFAQYEAAKNAKAEKGKGEEADKIRKQLLKIAEEAQAVTARAVDYVTAAPKILNQPIGIRVFARTDGYEIEIARSKTPAK